MQWQHGRLTRRRARRERSWSFGKSCRTWYSCWFSEPWLMEKCASHLRLVTAVSDWVGVQHGTKTRVASVVVSRGVLGPEMTRDARVQLPGTIYLVLRSCIWDVGSGPRCGLVGTGLGRLSFYYRSLLWVGLQVLARCHLHRHWGGSRCSSAPHPNQRHARLCCSPEEATLQALVSALQRALWQPLWPTCSLRPIRASRQGPKVSTLGRASPSTHQAHSKNQTGRVH